MTGRASVVAYTPDVLCLRNPRRRVLFNPHHCLRHREKYMKRVITQIVTIIPTHPTLGPLLPARLHTYKFRIPSESVEAPPPQAEWEWVLMSDLIEYIQEWTPQRLWPKSLRIAMILLSGFGKLMPAKARSEIEWSHQIPFNFIVLDVEKDMAPIPRFDDIQGFASLPENPEHYLVPSGWASAVVGLIKAGIFIVDNDGGASPHRDKYYGHSQNGDKHVEITLCTGKVWNWKNHTMSQSRQ